MIEITFRSKDKNHVLHLYWPFVPRKGETVRLPIGEIQTPRIYKRFRIESVEYQQVTDVRSGHDMKGRVLVSCEMKELRQA